jgi:hypothetical protein
VGSEGENPGVLLPLQTEQNFLDQRLVGISETETFGALSSVSATQP